MVLQPVGGAPLLLVINADYGDYNDFSLVLSLEVSMPDCSKDVSVQWDYAEVPSHAGPS